MANPILFIDPLRTRCWFRYVLEKSGGTSPEEIEAIYLQAVSLDRNKKIEQDFHSLNFRWKVYAQGMGRPSPKLLTAFEKVFKVSRQVYENGPEDTLLWKSLATQIGDVLQKISAYCKNVDGLIAGTRFKVMTSDPDLLVPLSNLHTHIGMEYPVFDALRFSFPEIASGLVDCIPHEETVFEIAQILVDEFEWYAARAFYSEITPSRVNDMGYMQDTLLYLKGTEDLEKLRKMPMSHLFETAPPPPDFEE